MTDVVHVGAKFGRWTVVSTASERKNHVTVECSCGRRKSAYKYDLARGKSSRCNSCAQKSKATKHGNARTSGLTPEYRTWNNIRQRCSNQNNTDYHLYGGRGIRVCAEWESSFEAFLGDMGPKPSPAHSIDRIDVNGDYCPSNCRWATVSEQANNKRNSRRFEAFGESLTSAEWGERFGLKPWTVYNRVSFGMTVEQALSKPVGKYERKGGGNGR